MRSLPPYAPDVGAGPTTVHERPTASTRWPLVGRYQQIEEFEAALSADGCDGLLIVGEAGVGKTRLAEHCRQEATRRGLRTARAQGSATAGRTPLAALAHLLPESAATADDAISPAALFADTVRFLAGPERLLLLVDDIHLLDGTSLVLLGQLLATGTVFLLGTVRSGAVIPDGLRALQRTDRMARIDLAPLLRSDVATVLHLGLGAPVDAVVEEGLWALTRGNPLALREAVRGAQVSGALVLVDGVWRARGPLGVSGRALDLVRETLSGCSREAREVLEVLALCQPVGLAELERIADIGQLDGLERAGLLVVESDGSRNTVTLAHPMYADALLAELTVTSRRRLLRHAAERLTEAGARRRSDVLRLAQWQVAAGIVPDGEVLLRAARLARFAQDFDAVENVARVAWRDLGLPEAAVLVGEALAETGRFSLAETVLSDAQQRPRLSDEVRADLVLVRATNLFRGLLDPRTALTMLRDVRQSLADPESEAAALLRLREAWIVLMNGNLLAAQQLLVDMPDVSTARVTAARAFVDGPVCIFGGRLAAGIEAARAGEVSARALTEPIGSLHPGLHVMHRVLANAEAGRLASAAETSALVHAALVGERAVSARIWTLATMGRVSLHQGQLATARRQFTDSLALAEAHDFEGPTRTALNGLAVAHGQRGEAEPASRAAQRLDAASGEFGFLAPEHFLGRAWAAYASGHPEEARRFLRQGADVARDTGHVVSEAWLLHDLTRMGDLTPAARLGELAAASDSEFLVARAVHAVALVARSAQRLAAASDEFERLGAVLLAAEAAAAAASAAAATGDGRYASLLRSRTAMLAARTEGAATPALVRSDGPAPLTGREREIGSLAAAGLSSREVADRLFLSPRTVDNHLQRIFTKLGISRRSELASALHLQDSASEGIIE